LKSHSHIW